ncbi:hypothetical protein [Legionella quateirensis]|uniref:Multifunctional virulence effector protein DrrA n=1 Tax=Legionella quateirensis TaxID=45072 RepID=A0A378KWK6_9GAMM|nr:hypothetical protein [Legionella quateirensis]KTD46276.1 multifunctional virulence effector protein DrrA [Legionella quateirensis]STY18955.1 substrate of the Dot/Icm secretion system [Legionella quateirensis]
MSNISTKKPIIVLSVIEPGTMGDLSFVDKMIDSYQNQENDQPFIILLNDLGDESLKDKSLVQTLKNKIGEENVRIIHTDIEHSEEITQSWQLREEIAKSKPQAIVYGPMIVDKDCAACKRLATINEIPFIVLPEYSYKYHGSNSIPTGPGPEAHGMFLGLFDENHTIHAEDEHKFGKSLNQLENENQLFFAYLNNHSSGRGANPETFKQELLSYLYFVTSTLAHSDIQKPAEVFTRITPEIFKSYIEELLQNNPYECGFEIHYNGVIHEVPGKDGHDDPVVTINLSNPFPLKKDTMIAMMQACKRQKNPVCATGDQSLGETISIGVPFFYQTMPWKKDLAKDLDSTAQVKNLDGVRDMNKQGFTFKGLSDADEFANTYNEKRDEWAAQYSTLSEHISDLHQDLPQKIEHTIQNQSKLGYPHRNRFHGAPVNPDEFSDMKDQFKEFNGDMLKANILADIKDKILGAPNEYVLNLIVNGFKHSPEYTILKTGQGAVTTLLHLETDSIKEFNKIVRDATEELHSKSNVSMS